jgi:carbamoyl-phosphate synthase small subunit
VSEALLVLEDGSAFRGSAFGARGEAFGEAVFNTAMAGYQEVLTDPSYTGQIVAMTAPHIGNYGVNAEDAESGVVRVAGFVVREASRRTSSWRATGSLADALEVSGVVGIEGIDTRRLTLRIRSCGSMRAGISTEDLDADSLVARIREQPGMDGADLAAAASVKQPYHSRHLVGEAHREGGRVFRVAAYDFGLKRGILRRLAENGCETTVFPARTPAADILAGEFDGVFISNGPGDPAATEYGVDAVRALLGHIPIFGVCLGHQLLALALGGRTYKLKFGHRGVNQPILDTETNRIEITSHNHGFAVDPFGWDRADVATVGDPARFAPPPMSITEDARPTTIRVRTNSHGTALLTHWNLNDGTLEGMRCVDVQAFSVQYHPEASPGPHDAGHLFGRFRELMG